MAKRLPESDTGQTDPTETHEKKEQRRRRILASLLVLLLLQLGCIYTLAVRYVARPEPLPDMVPLPVRIDYPPHYLFSIYGVDKPVGVAISPKGDRIYVAETGGERLIKIRDRDGRPLGSFSPPRTTPAQRSPVYLTTDSTGRVFVTDRLQHAVFVYDQDGKYLDTILAPGLTLSGYVSKQLGSEATGTQYAYNQFEKYVYSQGPSDAQQTLPAPMPARWAPLGVRIDEGGKVLVTDVAGEQHRIHEFPVQWVVAPSLQAIEPPDTLFGAYGQGNGQFVFPNTAVADSRGRIYVTDGNNARISIWDQQGQFLMHFGKGAGDGALSLPRGAAIDRHDRLHIADAVAQDVKVYDVSNSDPHFLFAFGSWGLGDGQFNCPNDVAADVTGRLYVVDRENNRLQVWSY